jgi:heat shock protein HslJ
VPSSLRVAIARLVLLAIIGLAGACVPEEDNSSGGLGGTAWTVVAIDARPTLADARPTMTFEFDGALSGSGGCNRYSGTFRTDRDRITIGQPVSTTMGCEVDRMAQEQAFGAALVSATTWRLTEQGTLELQGSSLIVAEPAPAADG